MLPTDFFLNKDYQINGVIHIGTHTGNEIEGYKDQGIKNIIGFEPLPHAAALFKSRYPTIQLFELALSDHNGRADFYRSNDGAFGQASSLLEFEDNNFGMTGGVKEILNVEVKRFDRIAEFINTDLYNLVVIDTQGSELKVLNGFGTLVDKFDFFCIECSEKPIYKGGTKAKTVVNFMKKFNFKQRSPIKRHDDIYFIKEGL